MGESDQNINVALEGIDEEKRVAIRRLVLKGAFVTPIVASFAMSGLSVEKAAAQSNTTNSGPFISDRRLKTDIVSVGTHPAGFGLYRYRYLWSTDEHVGVLAQEVREVMPEAVICGEDGFMRVDYQLLGLEAPSAKLPRQVAA